MLHGREQALKALLDANHVIDSALVALSDMPTEVIDPRDTLFGEKLLKIPETCPRLRLACLKSSLQMHGAMMC